MGRLILYETQRPVLKEERWWSSLHADCPFYIFPHNLHRFACLYAKKYARIDLPQEFTQSVEIQECYIRQVGKAMLTHEEQESSGDSTKIRHRISQIVDPKTHISHTCWFWMTKNIFLHGGNLRMHPIWRAREHPHRWRWREIWPNTDLRDEISDVSKHL